MLVYTINQHSVSSDSTHALVNKLILSIFTLHEQLRCHQSPVHSQSRTEYFYVCVVCVQLHTRVFLSSNQAVPYMCKMFIVHVLCTSC